MLARRLLNAPAMNRVFDISSAFALTAGLLAGCSNAGGSGRADEHNPAPAIQAGQVANGHKPPGNQGHEGDGQER